MNFDSGGEGGRCCDCTSWGGGRCCDLTSWGGMEVL